MKQGEFDAEIEELWKENLSDAQAQNVLTEL